MSTHATHDPPIVLLAAGGTGGHLFPAEALAEALSRRGITVDLATDERAERYGMTFPARRIHIVTSATVRGRDPISLARTAALLGIGTMQALRLLGRIQPSAVVGFGGYPTVPPVLAATLRKIPTLIHEQNAVMGRANKLLAARVKAIATSFGARIMADIVPPAIQRLDPHLQSRLSVVQQAREEDVDRVKDIYARAKVAAEVAPFFTDLPARIAAGHLIVARSGASTVAELAAIGRPAILVPLPHALDQDQAANAGVLETAGAAMRLRQDDFTPNRLAAEISALASAPEKLVAMAAAARSQGAIDAAERLADLVVATIERNPG
jgi:UDP-N-acetylglucosamine--N-acetylmuramyl-(pentapeptide) pyrophosphoryl-undecaprenol N-acetylglucosamine transferase